MPWDQLSLFLFESKSYNCCLKDFEMIKCCLLVCLLLSMKLADNGVLGQSGFYHLECRISSMGTSYPGALRSSHSVLGILVSLLVHWKCCQMRIFSRSLANIIEGLFPQSPSGKRDESVSEFTAKQWSDECNTIPALPSNILKGL